MRSCFMTGWNLLRERHCIYNPWWHFRRPYLWPLRKHIVLNGSHIYTESKTCRSISLQIHGVVSFSKLLRDWFHSNSIFSIYLKLFYLFDWVKFPATFKGSVSLQNTDYTQLSLICVDLFTCNTTRYSFLCVCLLHFKRHKTASEVS